MQLPAIITISNRFPNVFYYLSPAFFQAAFLLMSTFNTMDEMNDRITLAFQNQEDTFDFIVVGAGITGSVLANRLSEQYKVLMLEAGGEPCPHLKMPVLAYLMFGKEPEDWKYETVPQKHSSFGLENNVVKWPSGKGLGGSSLINGMVYIRGTVQGFDIMANQTEDPIWSMNNTLKYFKKIEDYNGYFNDGTHGKGGKMSIEKSFLSPFMENFKNAAKELGYDMVDPNPQGPVREGFSPMDLYVKNGRRWSTYDGYIQPVMNSRKNFVVRKYSYVYKVIIDEHDKAIGVEYFHHGVPKKAYARKEVILTAGAIQTPKILMLSGIGPKEHLESRGVKVKRDLPVGQTLQDKYGAMIGPFLLRPGSSITLRQIFKPMSYARWILQGNGELSTSLTEATYTIRSNISKREAPSTGVKEVAPDLHTYIITSPVDHFLNDILFHGSFNFKKSSIQRYFTPASGEDSFIQLITLAKPKGYGTVQLKDSHPLSPPLIDPNYLADKHDLDVLIEGVKFAVKIVEETKAFKGLNPSLPPISFPGCEHVKFRSDEYWECYTKHATATAYKYGGTVPMGKIGVDDGKAVVDSRLRVYGIKNLRVADASVLYEKYVSINHVTCIMMAELISDFLLKEYENEI